MSQQIVLGIDLGTTNSAVSFTDAGSTEIEPLSILQIATPGSVSEEQLLPSMLYIPLTGEFPSETLQLPWDATSQVVIGNFAKKHGLDNPDRLVHSAKSWLSNHHIDRTAALLPWNSQIAEAKWSPLAASQAYLEHLRQAAIVARPQLATESYKTVLTVPASFDDTARSLTHDAAARAGFGEVAILEEPIAAFYAWIAAHEDSWRDIVKAGDLVLVCDIGGGTADFSLIAVSQGAQGELELIRVSVGEHILLGGDNIDLAIAHALRSKLADQQVTIDKWQFLSLVHAGRNAKEVLLADNAPEAMPITVASRGASLFASAVSVTLTKEEVATLVLQGFFPAVAANDLPKSKTSVGLRDFGLDYAADPAFTKHLAKFLNTSYQTVLAREDLRDLFPSQLNAPLLKPTAVLFNGGICKADTIRQRICESLQQWCEQEVRELPGSDYDRAVSRGAAYFGALRETGQSLKIRSGTPFAYYIGVESSAMAIPGAMPELQGVCVVPQGMEEGTTYLLDREFGLLTGQEVEFRFFRAATRGADVVGSLVPDLLYADLEETSRLRLEVPVVENHASEVIPVKLRSAITDVGTLELWMQHANSDKQWKLEFNVRAEEVTAVDTIVANASPEQQQLSFEQIDNYYQKKN